MALASFDFPACISCNFSSFCISEKINFALKKSSSVIKQQLRLKRKEILCLPKKKFHSLYAIQKGALKAYQAEANGKEVIRGFYFGGEIVGYEAIYTGHYMSSTIALTDTMVCEIPYDKFLKLIHSSPELQKHLLHLISQQLNIGSYVNLPTAEQRFTAFLMDLAQRLTPGKNKSEFITLPMSRQDIGNYLNLTAETISRLFSRLRKNRIVAIKDKMIHFLSHEKLQLIAEGVMSVRC